MEYFETFNPDPPAEGWRGLLTFVLKRPDYLDYSKLRRRMERAGIWTSATEEESAPTE